MAPLSVTAIWDRTYRMCSAPQPAACRVCSTSLAVNGAGEQDALVGNGAHGSGPELTRTVHERQVSPRPVGREQVGQVDPLLGRGGLVRRVYPHPWNQRDRALLAASSDPQAQSHTLRLPGWAVQRPVKATGQIGKDRCSFRAWPVTAAV